MKQRPGLFDLFVRCKHVWVRP